MEKLTVSQIEKRKNACLNEMKEIGIFPKDMLDEASDFFTLVSEIAVNRKDKSISTAEAECLLNTFALKSIEKFVKDET